NNRAYVTGMAVSDGLIAPTPDAFQPLRVPGSSNGFLLKVNTEITDALQDPVEYATYLGGSGEDWVNQVVYDGSTNSVLVSGHTSSPDFPTTAGSFAPSYTVFTTNYEAFVAKLDLTKPPDQQMVFGTYLGARSASFALNV